MKKHLNKPKIYYTDDGYTDLEFIYCYILSSEPEFDYRRMHNALRNRIQAVSKGKDFLYCGNQFQLLLVPYTAIAQAAMSFVMNNELKLNIPNESRISIIPLSMFQFRIYYGNGEFSPLLPR
jgi:hypothetical protein